MKKRLVMLIAVLGMSAALLYGCGENGDGKASAEASENVEAAADDTASDEQSALEEKDYGPMVQELNLSDYVTLGEYKGLTVSYDVYEPTEDDVESAIESALERAATESEVTGRAVAEGDIVNIDYEGKKDGVAFDGGTAQGYDLTIGSHQFIDGFEDGLIGANAGDTLDLNLTFPENYSSAELAGQEVVFTVTVNSIKEKIIPELTDEIVPTLDADCSTVDEYRSTVRENIKKNAENTSRENTKSDLLKMAVENATVSNIPDSLIEEKTDYMMESTKRYASSYGVDVETFVSQAMQITMDEYEQQTAQFAKEDAANSLVVAAIAQAEGLSISDEDAKSQIEPYVESFGASDYDSLMKTCVGRGYREYIQMEKVVDWLYDNANVVAGESVVTSDDGAEVAEEGAEEAN